MRLAKRSIPKEKIIRTQVRNYLNTIGVFNWVQWQGPFSEKGVADICGILPNGIGLYIETKRPKEGKFYIEQIHFLNASRDRNCFVMVAESVDVVTEALPFDFIQSLKKQPFPFEWPRPDLLWKVDHSLIFRRSIP